MSNFRVKILKTTKGSPDGIQVIEYKEGAIYECPNQIAPSLVEIFVEHGWAIKGKQPVNPVDSEQDKNEVINNNIVGENKIKEESPRGVKKVFNKNRK
jgi:hypothetical protein